MEKIKNFLKRKDIIFTLQRYGIDALGAMAQGLFCTLLVGTILNTLGQQLNIGFLNEIIVTIGKGDGAVGYTVGFLVFQIGTLITTGAFGAGFLPGLVAVIAMAAYIVSLCRKGARNANAPEKAAVK